MLTLPRCGKSLSSIATALTSFGQSVQSFVEQEYADAKTIVGKVNARFLGA